jgi:hypothetical protein
MDFLLKTANLQGGDTRKEPKNTQFSKSRHTPEGKGPPHGTPSIPLNHGISRHSLSILSNQNTHRERKPVKMDTSAASRQREVALTTCPRRSRITTLPYGV